MYTNFFSLTELPFSIAPDPKYLFMSDRHHEALTHLTHGLRGGSVSSNGGFVLLTGEVGTGKTTMSRCLMADLPDKTQLAFILNPTLSSQELLATICDQLKIRYRKTGATLKTLTDKISDKLLKNHVNDINTLLIIDEAQHLDPQVLEQLRLLTNLETDTKKLLQVILIGQPELQQLLKRRDLRQLAQRITARYHLLPLNKSELALYIKHRLSVADCHRGLFNKSALATIHRLSQGVPRVINLICHSALMEAYNSNNAVVDKRIVLKAAGQALGDDFLPSRWWQHKAGLIALIGSLFFMVLLTGFWLGQKEMLLGGNSELPKIAVKEGISITATSPNVQPIEKVEQIANANKPTDRLTIVSSKDKVTEPEKVIVIKQESDQKAISADLNTKVIPDKVDDNYQIKAVEGVSEDLLVLFQAAMEETKTKPITPAKMDILVQDNNNIQPLTQMPAWVQNGVPNLQVEQHIYASNGQGWINVNGRDRYQGDMITPELQLSEILPQQIILIYQGEKFSLPALTNW